MRKYANGQSFLEGWRDEFKGILALIATEKTWALQRQKLIHFRVASVTWIALWRAVGVEPRISLWRSYAEGIGEFASNPEESWPSILAKTQYFALLNTVILSLLGQAYYGTDKALERHLDALRDMRQHAIEKGVVLDRGILDIGATDYDLGASLMDVRNEQIYPEHMKLFGLLREFADRIETGSVDEDSIANRWRGLCHECNAQILALGLGEPEDTEA